MARVPSKFLASTALAVLVSSVGHFTVAFIASPAPLFAGQQLRHRVTTLQACGGEEYDAYDADLEGLDKETFSGSGGDSPKGAISELIAMFYYGEFEPQAFVRFPGLWKGPSPGAFGKSDIKSGMVRGRDPPKGVISELTVKVYNGEFTPQVFVRFPGLGKRPPPGALGKRDITIGVLDDIKGIDLKGKAVVIGNGETRSYGKGYIWKTAEVSPGGLGLEQLTLVPYGKKALLTGKGENVTERRALDSAKGDKVAEKFDKAIWVATEVSPVELDLEQCTWYHTE